MNKDGMSDSMGKLAQLTKKLNESYLPEGIVQTVDQKLSTAISLTMESLELIKIAHNELAKAKSDKDVAKVISDGKDAQIVQFESEKEGHDASDIAAKIVSDGKDARIAQLQSDLKIAKDK
jgi:hypothetical protein